MEASDKKVIFTLTVKTLNLVILSWYCILQMQHAAQLSVVYWANFEQSFFFKYVRGWE